MRSALLMVAVCGPLFAQIGPFFVGVKAGVPLSDSFSIGPPAICSDPFCPVYRYSSKTKRYTFGPTVELRLQHGLMVEIDALYNRLNYDLFSRESSPAGIGLGFASTRTSRWTFPILLKRRYDLHRISPFVDGGIALEHLTGAESNFTNNSRTAFGSVSSSSGNTSDPSELTKRTTEGLVVGGGTEFRAARAIRLMPEIRYTRWLFSNFKNLTQPFSTPFGSNQNEVTFLLGIAF